MWNKELNVSRDPKGKTGLTSVHMDQVLYMNHLDGLTEVHTATEVFYFTLGNNFQVIIDHLNSSGYDFRKTDRSQVTDFRKLSRIGRTDLKQNRGYFEGTDKFVIFSEANFKIATKFFRDKEASS